MGTSRGADTDRATSCGVTTDFLRFSVFLGLKFVLWRTSLDLIRDADGLGAQHLCQIATLWDWVAK